MNNFDFFTTTMPKNRLADYFPLLAQTSLCCATDTGSPRKQGEDKDIIVQPARWKNNSMPSGVTFHENE